MGTMMNRKADVEKLLAEGKTIQIKPQGYSMYPMFIPERDQAVIAPVSVDKLKRGDVVLYRRISGTLVLHRILKRRPEGFYMVGDNQDEVEGPLSETQIIGRLIRFIRKGKTYSVTNPVYRAAAGIWLFLRPVRMPIMRVCAFFKKMVCRKRKA